MLYRRQFLSSAAAFLACAPAARSLGNTLGRGHSYSGSWTSRAIQTVARDNIKQPPVITGVSIQSTGKWIAVVGDDHAVGLLDVSRFEFVSHFARHRDWIRSARFSPDGSYLATAGNDARLLVWDMDSPGQVRELATQPQAIIDLDISPDGARIATVGFEDQLRIYQAANGRLLLSAVCPCGDMDCVAFSSDGGWIAAGGRNGVVRIWDSQSGAVVADLSAQRSRVRSLEFTSDGQLVACGDDCCVTVARPSDPANPQTLARHAGKLYAVKLIGPNLLATGGSDDLIHIWDLNSLQEIDTLVGHVGTVSCLDATEALLVSGSFDTQIRIWESEQRASRTEQPPALGATWGQGIDLK